MGSLWPDGLTFLPSKLYGSGSLGAAVTPSGRNGEQQCMQTWWWGGGAVLAGFVGYCWGT